MSTVRIAHISDPHFGTTTDQKILALTAVIKTLKPDAIALTGDITQRGHQDQFKAAKSFCENLAEFKILAVPGNHDLPLFNLAARALRPYHHFKNTFGFPLSSQLHLGWVDLIGLNTTHPIRHVQGELAKKELLHLNNFNQNSKIRIVLFHHPIDCAKTIDEKNLLIAAAETLPYLEQAQVDILLNGHIHDPLARLTTVRYPHAQRPIVVAVAGTCLSSRTRSGAPNSFNFLELTDNECANDKTTENSVVDLKITRYDLDSAGQFQPLSHVRFRREGQSPWRPR